ARAFKSGLAASNLAGGTYTISQKVASPTFTPPPGRFWESVNVNVVTATPGAVVRCTTDNTGPLESSPICGHPSFRRTTNLRARAFKAGMFASDVARAIYTVPQVAAPSFSPGSMWLSGGSLSVKITTETLGPDDSRGILQIKTVTSGTADTTVNALVTTLERQPLQGTFAAKLWFDNPRGLRDVNAQAFLMSYGADSRVNPSELAFEYLVN